ncbi:MAG: bacillithiol system redox-active protein YtxJ [Sphingobacteriales bacterium]|nr:bacillithiol system redox-active protein YtxJ [Sphingobacteriales bacterium]
MNWIPLKNEAQLTEIKNRSKDKAQLIFKHSTRCNISSLAKSRLERTEEPPNIDFYYLDLIEYRNISAKIAEEFAVFHESPQILLIKNGECIYDESHSGISMDEIIDQSKSH